MKTVKQSTRRIAAIALSLVLLCGVMMSTGQLPQLTADTQAETFSVDFQELTDIANAQGCTFTNGYYRSEADDTAINDWVDKRFSMYNTYYWVGFGSGCGSRAYLGQDGKVINGNADVYWRIGENGMLSNSGLGEGYLRSSDALTLQHDGRALLLQNFKAEVVFNTLDYYAGSVYISFHEQHAGKFSHTAIGTDNTALLNDAVIVANTINTSNLTGYEYCQGIVVRNPGEALDNSWAATIPENDRFTKDGKICNLTPNTDYKLTVQVVGTTVSILLTDSAGTVTYYNGQDTVTDTVGTISVGTTGRSRGIKTIKVTELDEEGNAVDIGTQTLTAARTAAQPYSLSADFEALADIVNKNNYTWTNDVYQSQSGDTAINEWVNARFGLYHSRENYVFLSKTYLGQGQDVSSGNLSYLQIESDGYLRAAQPDSYGYEYLRSAEALYLKKNGTAVQLENFEASMVFNAVKEQKGGVYVAFHQETPGKFGYSNNPLVSTDTSGNREDAVIIGAPQGVTSETHSSGLVIKSYEECLIQNPAAGAGMDAYFDLEKDTAYALYVKVVNGDVTVKLTEAESGAVILAQTVFKGAATGTAGGVSFGVTQSGFGIKSIAVQELNADGTQNNGTVFINDNTLEVIPTDGYELKAGSLVVTDANGVQYIPQRVNFRNGGNATYYEIPAAWGVTAPFTAEYSFVKASLADEQNVGNVGISINETAGGIRFVSRFTRTVEGDAEYVTLDGAKYEITDYGMLLGLTSRIGDQELNVQLAAADQYIQQLSAKQKGIYYDFCDDYVDMSTCVINFKNDEQKAMDITARAYVQIDVNGETKTLYSNTFSSSFADANTPAATYSSVTEAVADLAAAGKWLAHGRAAVIEDEFQMDPVNAGFEVSGEMGGKLTIQTVTAAADFSYVGSILNVSIDGNQAYPVYVPYGSAVVTLAENLPQGQHTVKVINGTSMYYRTLSVLNFSYTGELQTVSRDTDRLQIEVLGDSITCGYGLGGLNGQTYTSAQKIAISNSYYSYAGIAARALDADLSAMALCAQRSDEICSNFFPYVNRRSPKVAWDFEENQVDVVVVALGTNDELQKDAATTLTNVKSLLAAVREAYPDAYIVYMYGMMRKEYEQQYQTAINDMNDNKAMYLDVSTYQDNDGHDKHPDWQAHENIGNMLADFIRENCIG